MTAPVSTVAETYRRDQLALRAVMLYELTRAWTALNPADVAGTAGRWLSLMVELVSDTARRGVPRAQEYYRTYRAEQVGRDLPDGFFDDLTATPNDERIATSLSFVGPTGLLRRVQRGAEPEQAKRDTFVEVAGSATRLTLAPARETLVNAAQADDQAVGWARLTDSDPCYFCALLASRGPVYRSRQSASFQAHDHCACTVIPLFSRDEPWPGRAREWQQLYNATTGAVGGKEKLRAFRRAYTARRRALS